MTVVFVFGIYPNTCFSEYYKYTDSAGVVHFTDNPQEIPKQHRKPMKEDISDKTTVTENQKENDFTDSDSTISDRCKAEVDEALYTCKSLFNQMESQPNKLKTQEILEIHSMCSYPLVAERFTSTEKGILENLSRQAEAARSKYSKKDLEVIALMMRKGLSACDEGKQYPKKGLDSLDADLRQIWKEMSTALAQNDVNRAASYYSEVYQEKWKKQFLSFTPETRARIASDNLNAELHLEKSDSRRAVYQLITSRNGTRHSYQITFIRNSAGEWKIATY